jgi:TonB family protein
VVLLRTYFVALRPDLQMGKEHPPLDRFDYSGELPAGQGVQDQLGLLKSRLTIPSLAWQFSDTAAITPGKDCVLSMGFGEIVQVRIANLSRAEGGALSAEFSFKFGQKEAFRRVLPVKPGDPLLFAGHLDPHLPILSVMTVEMRMFPPDQQQQMAAFAAAGREDREAMKPIPPTQRAEEPYLPGIGDVTMPELVAHQNAAYPDAARPARMDGQVIIEITVDHEGNATRPRVLTSSSPLFEPSAMEAAKTYRYKPATKNSRPVSVTMNLVMIFKFTARPEK